MKSLVELKEFHSASEIADTINWKKVKSVSSLCLVAEIYEGIERYDLSKELLLMAFDRSPVGRNILYRLVQIAIKLGNLDDAEEYYDDFLEIAPHDNIKYILKYKIVKEKNADISELIAILEEFKEREYTEEWAYELAYLYHEAGNIDSCVDICDELILWFGEGRYVEKALELKMLHQPLNKLQEEKYRKYKQKRDGVVEVLPADELQSGEIVREPIKIPRIKENAGRFNTQNLQAELAKNMRQIMDATKKETVSDTMESIKRLVGDIPFLKIPKQEMKLELQPEETYTETEEEIDGSLKIDFKEILGEENGEQTESAIQREPELDTQITGQMSIEDVLSEWEKTKQAAEAESEQRRLESVKAKALQTAEGLMDQLADLDTYPESDDYEELCKAYLEEEEEEDDEEWEDEYSVEYDNQPEEEYNVEYDNQLEDEEDSSQYIESADDEQEDAISLERIQQGLEMMQSQVTKPISRVERVVQTTQPLPDITSEMPQFGRRLSMSRYDFDTPNSASLTDEQKKIFSYFASAPGLEEQLSHTIEGSSKRRRNSKTSVAGNIIIMGGRGCGKTTLATQMIKVFQKMDGHAGKVGKISAKVLNEKDASKLFEKISGGYLIIEQAGELTQESIKKLALLMSDHTDGLLVFLEDTKEQLEELLTMDITFTKKFTERIEIPIFSCDELVEFAQIYVKDNECVIDDMGILALYNCITNIQKPEEATSLTEVIDIVDRAIERAAKGGLKKIFGRKRYTDEGQIILKEKDFDKY